METLPEGNCKNLHFVVTAEQPSSKHLQTWGKFSFFFFFLIKTSRDHQDRFRSSSNLQRGEKDPQRDTDILISIQTGKQNQVDCF